MKRTILGFKMAPLVCVKFLKIKGYQIANSGSLGILVVFGSGTVGSGAVTYPF
jgi:hypothetical protein